MIDMMICAVAHTLIRFLPDSDKVSAGFDEYLDNEKLTLEVWCVFQADQRSGVRSWSETS